jgi:hypothetical protein
VAFGLMTLVMGPPSSINIASAWTNTVAIWST